MAQQKEGAGIRAAVGRGWYLLAAAVLQLLLTDQHSCQRAGIAYEPHSSTWSAIMELGPQKP